MSINMRTMIDAAFPSKVLAKPPKCDAIAGYIGGNTSHIWTEQEWDDVAKATGASYRLPIFVRNIPANYSPKSDATFCANWARQHNMPPGTDITLDFETAINYTYVKTFDSVLSGYGYKTLLYGSRAFVILNPKPSGGYWVADYTGVPHLYPGSMATQWSGSGPFNGAYDPNIVSDDASLWKAGGPLQLDAEDRTFISNVVEASMKSTHQDIVTVLRGDDTEPDQHPGNLSNIWNLLINFPDAIANAVVAKLPSGTSGLTIDQLKQAVKDALKEGTGV